MSIDTLILILEAVGVAAAATFVFVIGHRLGRRSCRNEYPDGWDQGKAAERERWEQATGTTLDALAAWQDRRQPEPDLEGGWQEPPPTDVLRAEYHRQGYAERVPSVAEIDQMAARWAELDGRLAAEEAERAKRNAAEWDRIRPGWREEPPVVADLTGPAAWHYPGEDDVATVIGVPVPPPQQKRTGPEWLECQLAAQDSEAAAWMRGVEAEMASFRRGIGTRP